MNFLENLSVALGNLKTNRLRSILTMLGIIIGISSVITITTIGTSMQKTIEATLKKMGNTGQVQAYVSAISPDFETEEEWENWEYPEAEEQERLNYEKFVEIQEAFPEEILSVNAQQYVGSGEIHWEQGDGKIDVQGITPDFLDLYRIKLMAGRTISHEDNLHKVPAAVVSNLFVKYACGGENPIGKCLTIELGENKNLYQIYVVGVYQFDRSQMAFDAQTQEKDMVNTIYIPLSCAELWNQEENGYSEISDFSFLVADAYNPQDVADQVRNYVYDTYFAENGKFELEVYSMTEDLGEINKVLSMITLAISVIAAISLVVGGVGVMNIMLVSVVERTREIGIRKALGAKNSSIKHQFVTEAVVICLLGGIIGILIGILNGFLLSAVGANVLLNMEAGMGETIQLAVSPSVPAILISVVFSILTGVIFGYYPAKRAANMSPIDALRYE